MNDDNIKHWRYVSKDGKVRFCRVGLTPSAMQLEVETYVFEKSQLCCSESEWNKRQNAVTAYLTDECWRDFTIC